MLTFLPIGQINEMDQWEGSQLNKAKEILAYELTKLVHGEEEANKALEASLALFGGGAAATDMPGTVLTAEDLTDGKITVIDVLVKTKLAPSKGEARRLIQGGGLSINNIKVTDVNATIASEQLIDGKVVLLRQGKKNYFLLRAE
jgi:tyrosyl-tRNA synthetase